MLSGEGEVGTAETAADFDESVRLVYEGGLDYNSSRCLGGSLLILSSPLGQASFCICLSRKRYASFLLGSFCCCWASSRRFFQALPEVMSSVACLIWVRKYRDGGGWYNGVVSVNRMILLTLGDGVSGGWGSSRKRNGGPVSHQEACRSFAVIGRVP